MISTRSKIGRRRRQVARNSRFTRRQTRQRVFFELLESRQLLAVDLASPQDLQADAVTTEFVTGDVTLRAVAASAAAVHQELVVVDAATPDKDVLIQDILRNQDPTRHWTVRVLAGDRGGVEQISEILRATSGWDALHVIAHGSAGELRLGTEVLSAATLPNFTAAIGQWGAAFNPHADILLYGCNLAAGATGTSFVDEIARLTGADVAASTDLTGNTAWGGDWTLEYAHGAIDTRVVVDARSGANWSGILEAFNQTDSVVLDRQTVSGHLQIEAITAYNLVVDSNVEAPSTNGPRAAHLGVRLTNTSPTTTLTNVVVNIGDLLNAATGTGTPGVYPQTIVDPGYVGGYTGTFQLTHDAGMADATRYVPSLAPGASVVEYFLVSYPVTDAANHSVAGAAPDPNDDLKLYYDIWAQATEGATTQRVYDERQVTARNEISAMANKVWPNTTGKVPDEYLDAIQAALGWRPGANPRIPGALISEGIWYDLGNVGAGFDNDGDLVPDRNAWMQPIGDASRFDAECMRLAKSYGIVIVKLRDGSEQLIPFEDQLYFEHIPDDNIGAVGLVYYEFLPLQANCSATLSPYQEVASGYDNEKFNGDYGAGSILFNAGTQNIAFDKTAPASTTLGSTTTFNLQVTNTGTAPYGVPLLGSPLTVEDSVPAGTVYVSGSATSSNTLPSGVGVNVFYYDGTSWLSSEPANPALVQKLRWQLTSSLPASAVATVRFSVGVPITYVSPTIDNCAEVNLGGVGSLGDDCTQTLVSGPYALSGSVFRDDGAGGGTSGDAVRNGTETYLGSIGVALYLDTNNNQLVDPGDLLWATTNSSNADGTFSFTNLPAGHWVVRVDGADGDRPTGYVLSTEQQFAATITSASVSGIEFGFAPTLGLTKTLLGPSPVNEGTRISYQLTTSNLLKPDNYASSLSVKQDLWVGTISGSSNWTSSTNAAGAPNGTFASTNTDTQVLIGTGPVDDVAVPNTTPIEHVEAILRFQTGALLASDETLTVTVTRLGVAVGSFPVTLDSLNQYFGSVGLVSINVTGLAAWGWADLTAANTGLSVTYNESGTSPTVSIDAMGFEVTSSNPENRSGSVFWTDSTTTFKAGQGTGGDVELLMTGLPSAPTDVAFDEVNNHVLLANGSTILTRSPDGAAVASFSTGGGSVTGLAVDPQAGYIYWSEANAIKRATLAGTSLTTLVSSLTSVQGLTIDPVSGQLFWIQANANNVKIQRSTVSGSGVTLILDDSLGAGGNSNPKDIEFDPVGAKLYFTTDVTGSNPDYIGTVNLDGSNPQRLVGSGVTSPTGLAIDSANGRVYWADSAGIKSATLTGTNVTTIYPNLATVSDVEVPQFSVDNIGTFDFDKTLANVPLTDDYDPAELTFVSASVAPSSVDQSTGLITWDNIGPINPGMSRTIVVTFDVREPAGNATDTSVINTSSVSGATIANGLPANDDTAAVTITVNPTARVGDYVWSDKNSNGAQDSGEPGIPGVTVQLVDVSTSMVVQTTVTDASGHYFFNGVTAPDGGSTNYRVDIVTSSLPSGFTRTFDADGIASANQSSFTLANPAGATGPADNLTQDFGYHVSNILFGNVWRDFNADGSRATLDAGISGVTVQLLDASNTVVATTTTASDGTYRFTGVADGSYRVQVSTATLPALGTWTQTADPDPTLDNRAPTTAAVTVSNGDVAGAYDFGYALAGTGSIGDEVFYDWDQDGVRDSIDEGIPNITVRLYLDANGSLDPSVDPLVATTATNATGSYLFANLPAGHYTVVLDVNDLQFPDNVVATTDNPHSSLLFSGTNDVSVDFGYLPFGNGSITGNVWHDRNLDQAIESGEEPLPAVAVTLWVDLNGDGNFVALQSTSSAADGSYSFSSLPYGAYRIVVDSSDPDIPESSSGRTYDPTTATQLNRTLTSGSPTATGNFGFAARPSIGDYVYYDGNRNGTQDLFETGIPGVTVELILDANGNGVVDGGEGVIATTVTDDGLGVGTNPAGFYQFNSLNPSVPGQYYLVRVNTSTLPQSGLLNSGDPDRDGVPWTGSPDAFPAADNMDSSIYLTTAAYTGADLGYVPTGVVGDRVWLDLDQDGIQDTAEQGIAGVTVTVTNGVVTQTTTTDADGYYLFYGLGTGNWTVSISGSPITGKAPTYDGDGTATANSTSVTMSGGVVTNPFGSLGVDFGLSLGGSYGLSGTVCTNDANVPGVCDDVDNFLDDGVDLDLGPTDEQELAGFTVYLYTATGTPLGATTTDARGNYAFSGLPNGTYQVSLDTTQRPLDRDALTTSAADTPATTVTDFGTSVVQAGIVISGADVTNVDFAFVPAVSFDFGDLPLAYGSTTMAQDGARHIIPPGGATIYLGAQPPDADPNGAASNYADGDDTSDGNDDEDGVVPLNISSWSDGPAGGAIQVTVPAGKTGYLVGWIDFNHDNTLLDAGEFVVNQWITGTGAPQTISFAIPAGTIGATDEAWLSRFRIFTAMPAFPQFSYAGEATDGEVEDQLLVRTVGAGIGDFVWADGNHNGLQDANEYGIPCATVTLLAGGNPIASMLTSNGTSDVNCDGVDDGVTGDGVVDPVGYYRLAGLAPGGYTVQISLPAGYSYSYDEDTGLVAPDGSTNVVLLANEQHTTADFGLLPATVNISGAVYYDANHDNVFGGDTPVGATRIQLWTDPNGDGDPADGTQVAEAWTNTSGQYMFAGIPAYRYVIVEVDPSGMISDADTQGANNNRIFVNLTGTNSTGNNFLDDGPAPVSLGGTVYNDGGPGVFGNDVFSADDTGIGSVALDLYFDANGNGVVDPLSDPLIDAAATSGTGSYAFANLPNGNYVVRETDPAGLVSDDDTSGSNTDNQVGVALSGANSTGNDFLDDDLIELADLSLDKSVDNAMPTIGQTVTFTLDIHNAGPATATNVTVADLVPSGFTYLAASIAGGSARNDASPASGSGLTWTINSLGSGATTSLSFQATVLSTGSYDNYAQITGLTQTDPNSTPGNGPQTPDEDDDDVVTVVPTVTTQHPPVADDDIRLSVPPGAITLLAVENDSDPDNNLAPDTIDLDPTQPGQQTSLVVAGEGTWTLGSGGWVTFTPNSGFTTDPTPIHYTIQDTTGLTSNVALILVEFNPIATNDSSTGNAPGTAVTLLVPANDTTGDTVDPTTVQIVGTGAPGAPLIVPGEGTWTVNTVTGAITFTPQPGFTDDPTPIHYTILDDEGNISNPALVIVDYVDLSCSGHPFTLVIDDSVTPAVDVIVVDNAPIGTPTALGPSNFADGSNSTIGEIYFSGSTPSFPLARTSAKSKPLVGASGEPQITLTSAFRSSGGGTVVVQATDSCFKVVAGAPYVLQSPIGGTTNGTVTFRDTVDPANQDFASGPNAVSNLIGPVPAGTVANTASSPFTPPQFYVSLDKQITITHPTGPKLTTLTAEGSLQIASTDPRDVNRDGFVSPIDALLIIDFLNDTAASDPAASPPSFAAELDVNGDGYVSAVDALLVINYLNDQAAATGGEGEDAGRSSSPPSDLATTSASAATVDDGLVALLAEQLTARRRARGA